MIIYGVAAAEDRVGRGGVGRETSTQAAAALRRAVVLRPSPFPGQQPEATTLLGSPSPLFHARQQNGRDREEATKMFFYMATKMVLFTHATDSLQPHPRAKNYLFFPNLSSFAAWFFIILVKQELPCYITSSN